MSTRDHITAALIGVAAVVLGAGIVFVLGLPAPLIMLTSLACGVAFWAVVQ